MSEAGNMAKSITLWTFTIGAWSDARRVKPLLDAFTRETGTQVRLESLTYEDGDRRIRSVLGTDAAPDLVMEGPQRIVADWGASGYMEDLGDLFDPAARKELHRSVLSACTAPDGSVYVYPLVRTVHCMAINLDAFRAADALRFVDLRKHTWTTEQFRLAVASLSSHFGDNVATVYCGGQGGDQGTRALVTNLYDGPFTDEEHTRYTWDDPRIIRALEELRTMRGIYFDPYIAGGEEIQLFRQGKLKMCFCWNAALHLTPGAGCSDPGKTANGERITFMGFPSPKGIPRLSSGIWGFGVFRREDPARVAAAKAFIRFICNSGHTREAVRLAGHLAARTAVNGEPLTNMWSDNPILREYNMITPYIVENEQVAKGWRDTRTAWWTMLQRIGEGGDIAALTARYMKKANQAVQG